MAKAKVIGKMGARVLRARVRRTREVKQKPLRVQLGVLLARALEEGYAKS